jgi:hypothetical protein
VTRASICQAAHVLLLQLLPLERISPLQDSSSTSAFFLVSFQLFERHTRIIQGNNLPRSWADGIEYDRGGNMVHQLSGQRWRLPQTQKKADMGFALCHIPQTTSIDKGRSVMQYEFFSIPAAQRTPTRAHRSAGFSTRFSTESHSRRAYGISGSV